MKADITNAEKAYIEKYGKHYTSAALPSDVSYGRVGWCFDECFIRALKSHGKYQYVEGMATDPDSHEWILHAWLTDGEHAYDVTWSPYDHKRQRRVNMPLPSAYIGIEMPIEKVLAFMQITGYQGVIPNRHRAPMVAKDILGWL